MMKRYGILSESDGQEMIFTPPDRPHNNILAKLFEGLLPGLLSYSPFVRLTVAVVHTVPLIRGTIRIQLQKLDSEGKRHIGRSWRIFRADKIDRKSDTKSTSTLKTDLQ